MLSTKVFIAVLCVDILLFAFLAYIAKCFLHDFFFYRANGWNFEEEREGALKVFDGDPGGDEPLSGRKRFYSQIFCFVICAFLFVVFLAPLISSARQW